MSWAPGAHAHGLPGKRPSGQPHSPGTQGFLGPGGLPGRAGVEIQEGKGRGRGEPAERTPALSQLMGGGAQSWGLGLPLALGLDLKEKRLIRRREKLPAFFRTLGVAAALERSSCDWLRPASLCRGLRRKSSFVPLRRKLTVGETGG